MKNYTIHYKGLTKLVFLLTLFSSVFIVSSCKNDDDSGPVRFTNIKLVNAIVGSTGLDLYIDDNRRTENIGFGASTAYFEVPQGNHTVKATPAGSTATTVSVKQSFAGDTNYSIFAINKNEALVVVDTVATPPSNVAWVRYVNLSPTDNNASYLVKYVGNPENFDFAAQPYKQVSKYKAFAPSSYVFNAFDVLPAEPNMSVNSEQVTLAGGKVYTLFLIGAGAGNTLALKIVEE